MSLSLQTSVAHQIVEDERTSLNKPTKRDNCAIVNVLKKEPMDLNVYLMQHHVTSSGFASMQYRHSCGRTPKDL